MHGGSQKAGDNDFKEKQMMTSRETTAETHMSTVGKKQFDEHSKGSGPGATRFLGNMIELHRDIIASLHTQRLNTIACLLLPCPAV